MCIADEFGKLCNDCLSYAPSQQCEDSKTHHYRFGCFLRHWMGKAWKRAQQVGNKELQFDFTTVSQLP